MKAFMITGTKLDKVDMSWVFLVNFFGVCAERGGGDHQKLVAYGIFKLGLVWVQAVCKGYQQTTLVGKELR